MTEALKQHTAFREGKEMDVSFPVRLSDDQLSDLIQLREAFKDQRLEPMFDDVDHGNMLCPVCGHNEMHQFAADIQWRQEDSPDGLHISSNTDEHIFVSTEIDDSLGYRREAIAITFWCEGCGSKSTLLIFQRKGRTYMEWDKETVFREINS